ncbi:hypothetical protein BaRGS_00013668 [Batillaria attramentaria]|uniref:Uncharacterized protein n=1 Tax=Batillaria attramentaria TaxID=370345 RepID=A0ABD0L6R6_9CAEN
MFQLFVIGSYPKTTACNSLFAHGVQPTAPTVGWAPSTRIVQSLAGHRIDLNTSTSGKPLALALTVKMIAETSHDDKLTWELPARSLSTAGIANCWS